jgi:hypothetical protein
VNTFKTSMFRSLMNIDPMKKIRARMHDRTIWDRPYSKPAIFPFLMAIFRGSSRS